MCVLLVITNVTRTGEWHCGVLLHAPASKYLMCYKPMVRQCTLLCIHPTPYHLAMDVESSNNGTVGSGSFDVACGIVDTDGSDGINWRHPPSLLKSIICSGEMVQVIESKTYSLLIFANFTVHSPIKLLSV